MTVKPVISAFVDTSSSVPASSLREIAIELVDVSLRHRKTDPEFVAALAADMAVNGQISPIDVVEVEGRFRLIHGAARVRAMEARAALTIQAVVTTGAAFASETSQRLRAIPAQLVRRDLSVLDKAAAVAEWRDLYELASGIIRPGRKSNQSQVGTNSDEALLILSEQFAGTFTDAARKALSLSKMGVFRALKIAAIEAPVRDAIALHPLADNQAELLALAEATPAHQQQASAVVLSGGFATFSSALRVLAGEPVTPVLMPWETFSQRFTRMKEVDQEQFFNANADAIERWWVRRSNR